MRGHLATLGRRLSARSQARHLAAIRMFHRFLVAERHAKDDPTEQVETPRQARRLPIFLTLDEVEALLERLLGGARLGRRERVRYRDAVEREVGLDPLAAPLSALAVAARDRVGPLPEGVTDDRDALLDLLMAVAVGPKLGRDGLTFIFGYPASQAALARVTTDGTAARFEAYLDGLELCNGFEELADSAEQRRRFDADRQLRATRGLASVAPDERLLAALAAGLPPCAGVALGFDRVLMLAAGASDISSVLAFPTELA